MNHFYMELSTLTQYPQILYTFELNNKYCLKFISCVNYNCQQYNISSIYNFNGIPKSYLRIDFIYNEKGYPLISYNAEPHGLYLIK